MTHLKKFFFLIIFPCFLIFPFTGCDVTRQAQQVSDLASCDFRILSASDINVGGVMLQNIKSVSDLNFSDVALIMAGLASPTLPLTLQLNIEGRNPNVRVAGLNRLEWILFIDDNQMTSGILDKPITIPAKGTSVFPVQIGLDLKQVLSGKSASAILNFCMNLTGVGNEPTRFKIKLKPTIIVSGKERTLPGYITVKTEYASK
jgi:hypothetical protein